MGEYLANILFVLYVSQIYDWTYFLVFCEKDGYIGVWVWNLNKVQQFYLFRQKN